MRGDSLRDFYAKTLAVVGLGLIAGAGAIVDYWPTGIRLPALTSPALARITTQPLVQNLHQQIPAPSVVPVAAPVRAVNARHVRWPGFLPKSETTTAASRPAPRPAADTTASASANPDAAVSFAAAPVTEWAPDVIASLQLAPGQLDELLGVPPAPTGFIGGALKKTKDSLVKTGAVTGGSIADAFRGVVGAFKKVSPF